MVYYSSYRTPSPQGFDSNYHTVDIPIRYQYNPCQGVGFPPSYTPTPPINDQIINPQTLSACIGKWTYFWTENTGEGWMYVKSVDESNVYGCVWIYIDQWFLQYRYIPMRNIYNYIIHQ